MLRVVEVAEEVAATSSKRAKVASLAGLLRELEPDEVVPAVGMLVGRPRQGRTGVGWRTLSSVRGEPSPTATLTVLDVDLALQALAQAGGSGSAAVRTETLQALLAAATSAEQDFLTRVLLGDMRTGALDAAVLDAVAAATGIAATTVRRAAMLTGAVAETARLALAGADLGAIGLTPGVPVLPMLAGTAATASEAVATAGEASVEAKLDGARLQVHRTGGTVRAYTRSLADITDRVPEVVALVESFPGGDLILDGETLRLGEDGKAKPFAETMSRFGRHTEVAGQPASHLSTFFFDMLHADGEDLLGVPLGRRRELLAQRVGAHLVPGEVTDDPEVAERVLAEALAAGHEGVVVKGIDSTYEAGRRGKRWLKVKPVLTFDLVVLGAEWGYGRRTGWLSNLHLGARDPEGEFGEAGGFVMVGKTFKGLTDALLRWQTEYFPTIARPGPGTPGVVMVEPSTVVEIAIDGVQRSTRYPGGVALRFARVKRYRTGAHAKPPAEADTIDSLRALLR
ncbi:ATP-dependent DNA ligase [Pseudactinotalea suaedae]|uniref:ATP-dependent DNA ligase n=1 Tax=Pseudactinotalea suaedae TaxID=1524924 RepID=UPI0012E204BF|nr:ATP-dependent DNA ligase [Pseudactinotalea suaedae]